MISRPAGRRWRHPAKAQATEIERIDKGIDHAHCVVFVNPVVQPFGKQRSLAAVHTLNEALRQILPPNTRES